MPSSPTPANYGSKTYHPRASIPMQMAAGEKLKRSHTHSTARRPAHDQSRYPSRSSTQRHRHRSHNHLGQAIPAKSHSHVHSQPHYYTYTKDGKLQPVKLSVRCDRKHVDDGLYAKCQQALRKWVTWD